MPADCRSLTSTFAAARMFLRSIYSVVVTKSRDISSKKSVKNRSSTCIWALVPYSRTLLCCQWIKPVFCSDSHSIYLSMQTHTCMAVNTRAKHTRQRMVTQSDTSCTHTNSGQVVHIYILLPRGKRPASLVAEQEVAVGVLEEAMPQQRVDGRLGDIEGLQQVSIALQQASHIQR
jgi:hypothetical protein